MFSSMWLRYIDNWSLTGVLLVKQPCSLTVPVLFGSSSPASIKSLDFLFSYSSSAIICWCLLIYSFLEQPYLFSCLLWFVALVSSFQCVCHSQLLLVQSLLGKLQNKCIIKIYVSYKCLCHHFWWWIILVCHILPSFATWSLKSQSCSPLLRMPYESAPVSWNHLV